jgi:hypothetical protein
MKQSTLLRWIEMAESARFCRLAEENPAAAKSRTPSTSPAPFNLSTLRRQLCLGDAVERLGPWLGCSW